jgi:hypothetical protein
MPSCLPDINMVVQLVALSKSAQLASREERKGGVREEI